MTIDKFAVTAIGGALIGFFWWFFFGKKEEPDNISTPKVDAKNEMIVDIIVDGGYKPAVIFLKRGVKTNLKVTRKDTNTCLGDIILPDFKISKYLPIGKTVNIEITPQREGEYPFHCGMNMFHGKIIVD